MEWNKQAEDMVKAWTDVQKKMWESWLTPMQANAPAGAEGAYRKAVETWEGSVKRALDAQVDWTRRWAEGLSAGQAATEAAAASARQVHEVLRLWTDQHRQLWETWFNTLKQLDAGRASGAAMWEKEAQKVMQVWQDAAKAAQQAMTEWTAVVAKKP